MSTTLIGLIMDIAVLAALAGTIYYTMRLSKSLNNFRSSREDLKRLVAELSQNIDKAETAMVGLRKSSNTAADDLEGLMHDAKKMAEELKFINETSNGLAGRMERLAQTNREIAETLNAADAPAPKERLGRAAAAAPVSASASSHRPAEAANVDSPAFFIQDREFEAGGYDMGEEDGEDWGGASESGPQFSSKAERELYEALQKNKSKSR